MDKQHVPGQYPGAPGGIPFALSQPGPGGVGAPTPQPYVPPGGLTPNTFQPNLYGSSASPSGEAAASYVTPQPNTVGPHGFLLKYGTANDPVDAYHPEPGETGIVIDASYYRWWMAVYLYATTKPRIFVDGIEVPDVSWGTTQVPVAPGLHHIEVCTGKTRWFFRNFMSGWAFDIGFADTVVPVTDGRRTPVYYRPPALRMWPGAIGPKPPRWPGLNWMRFTWLISAALVGFFGLMAFTAVQKILN
ncbi:hypothetical protein AB0H00_28610 [Nocardia sp. NPDC023852]|uniref:hypothetical protein n=1 Tax=Nocardia sp. NPDC023852 TaxID=3154697 RepID=UPI0033D61F77